MPKELEQRYIVIKVADIKRYCGPTVSAHLGYLIDHINDERRNDGRDILEGIFIEKDWPEYKDVVDTLLKRIGGN